MAAEQELPSEGPYDASALGRTKDRPLTGDRRGAGPARLAAEASPAEGVVGVLLREGIFPSGPRFDTI